MMTDFHSQIPDDAPENPFERLCWIMERLLGPGGCPWDREQTHESIKQYMIEEAYEAHEAIETGDPEYLKEELGDVALQVVFHAAMAERQGHFRIDDVLDGISEKLIRRHPHVFGKTEVAGSGEVLQNWEQIKKKERSAKKKDDSLVAGVPRSLPALQKALRIQQKVRRVGFDWPDIGGALEKAREEFEELAEETKRRPEDAPPSAREIEEFGDLLFALTNVARKMGIQPEEALQFACGKFARRFRHVERRAEENNLKLQEMTLDEMDAFWEEAKEADA